jgi:hypothetical protein
MAVMFLLSGRPVIFAPHHAPRPAWRAWLRARISCVSPREVSPSEPADPPSRWTALFPCAILLALFTLFVWLAGCNRVHLTDTTPLDATGMSFSAIEELRKLDVTNAEVADLVKAKQGGISDDGCVELVRIARNRHEPFSSGDAVLGLRQAGMNDPGVLELARLNQLGLGVGELQAMRLAGISDFMILEVARRHSASKPVFSGVGLVELKNAGFGDSLILELIRRGLSDDQKDALIALRHRRLTDAAILAKFPAPAANAPPASSPQP